MGDFERSLFAGGPCPEVVSQSGLTVRMKNLNENLIERNGNTLKRIWFMVLCARGREREVVIKREKERERERESII